MRLMKRIFLMTFAGLALASGGCTIELGGLREVAQSIDGMRAQLDKTTGEGKDLDRLLETARKDVDKLIEKAAKEGGKLEEKFVLEFIEERKAIFAQATALMKKTNLTLKGSAFSVTHEFSEAMGRLPAGVADQIGPIVLAIPGVFLSTHPVQIEGTEITFRPGGYYRLLFDARQAANLDVRVDHKTIYSPRNPTDTRVAVEIPASSLCTRFGDKGREFVPIELVERGRPGAVRFLGSLDLKPLFGVQYKLTEIGPKGLENPLVIHRGPALDDIVAAVGSAMKAAGEDPVKIATRHAQIYAMARERLPYGPSFVDLSPGVDDFELTVTLENGVTRILDQNRPEYGGVRLTWKERARPDMKTFLRVSIDAVPQSVK